MDNSQLQVPWTYAKGSHEGVLHPIHELKGIGSSYHEENERQNDEGMDNQANHYCHNEQGKPAHFTTDIFHAGNPLCYETAHT